MHGDLNWPLYIQTGAYSRANNLSGFIFEEYRIIFTYVNTCTQNKLNLLAVLSHFCSVSKWVDYITARTTKTGNS